MLAGLAVNSAVNQQLGLEGRRGNLSAPSRSDLSAPVLAMI
jgi:hypothetical protein